MFGEEKDAHCETNPRATLSTTAGVSLRGLEQNFTGIVKL